MKDGRYRLSPLAQVGGKVALLGHVGLAILLAGSLSSCGEEDRMVDVACEPASGEGLRTDFSPNNTGTAWVTAHEYPLGAILELVPPFSAGNPGELKVAYQLSPRGRDSMQSPPSLLWAKLVQPRLKVSLDPDLQPLLADVQALVRVGTILTYTKPGRMLLRDGLAQLNADPRAVAAIANGPAGSRYLLVLEIGRMDDPELNMDAPGPFVGANAARVRSMYLHFRYTCFPRSARGSGAEQPRELLVYVAVRFDRGANRVVPDERTLDPTQFRLDGAAP